MMNYFSFKKMIAVLFVFLISVFSFSAFATQTETAYTTYPRFNESGVLLGTISASTPTGYLATRNSYDANGILFKVENGSLSAWQDDTVKPASWLGFTVFSSQVITYDSYGRKSTVTAYDKNGVAISLTQMNYDSQSRLNCQAVRMNRAVYGSLPDACSVSTEGADGPDRITQFTYDLLDQPLTVTKAFGTSLVQTYSTNTYTGRFLTSQTDANGNRTELYYDSNGRLSRMIYPSPTTPGVANGTATGTTGDYVEFTYDPNGNKLTERKRKGVTLVFTYDANNRLIEKNMPDGTQSICYDYDLRGLQTQAHFSGSPIPANCTPYPGLTQTYDGFGNLKSTTNNQGSVTRALNYSYDDNSNRNQLIHPDGATFSYSFDQLNRVTGVSDSASANNNILNVNYQANGRRNNIVRNNGAAGTTYYSFSNGVQLDNFQQTFAGTANNLSNTFAFNQAGQISTLTQSNSSYFYVGNDNRTGVYVPDGLNRYNTIAGQPMGYDANSNMTNDGLQTYTYDDENRLLTTSSASATSNFVYDANGRLFQVTINGVRRQFLWDNNALVVEYDTNGAVLKRYVHGDQVDEPWVQFNGSSTAASNRRYLHSDHQGSIIAESDSAGNIALQPNGTQAKFAYDGFGIPIANNSDTFGYTGQLYFKELNLNYYKARFYSPKIGRFLQTDPIGYKDDMDLYSYVGNDFINKTDPTGLFEFDNCTVTGAGKYSCGFSGSSSSSSNSSKPSSSNNGSSNETSGSSSSTPSTQAASSAEPAQMAFYEHGTKADSTPYNATVAVYANGYSMVQTGANTWPSWSSRNPGIQAGTFKGAWGLHAHKGRAGIVLNNNGRISTVGPNGNQNGNNYADGIHVHSGGVKDRGSEGCLTFCNLTANSIFNFLSVHTSSPDVLVTVKRDE